MTRYLLIVELEPSDDVEPYMFAGRIENYGAVRSVLVMPVEDGEQLVKMSVVKEAISEGRPAMLARQQAERRAELEHYDQAADRVRAAKIAERANPNKDENR